MTYERERVYYNELKAMLPEGYEITEGPYLETMGIVCRVAHDGKEEVFAEPAPVTLSKLATRIQRVI